MRVYQHTSLAKILTDDIRAGRYGVGDKIPTEQMLQERFDASRHAVREALKVLKKDGLLVSRPGVGTVVRSNALRHESMRSAGNLQELTQFAEARRMKLLGSTDLLVDEALAAQLGVRPGQLWIETEVLRFLPDEALPMGQVTLYIRPEHREIVAAIDGTDGPVHALIRQTFELPIAEVKQQIIAILAEPHIASLLSIPAGTPVLKITRQFLDAQDKPILISVGKYPSDRFSHDTVFRVQHNDSA